MQENKVNFFKRCKVAILDFDKYASFLLEKPSTAIKYLLILVLLTNLLITAFMTYGFSGYVDKGFNFFYQNIPNFTFQDKHLVADDISKGYDEEYDLKFILDTNDLTEEQIEQYKGDIDESTLGLIFLSDKLLYKQDTIQEQTYSDFITEYGTTIPESFTKQDVENLLSEKFNKPTVLGTIFTGTFPVLFFTNLITIISDIILVSLIGLIAARFAKLGLKYSNVISLAIYSLSLPIILNAIYMCVYQMTGFTIKYFNFMYISVAYIYMIAAIFMIRTDIIKQMKDAVKNEKTSKEDTAEDTMQDEKEVKDKEKEENREENREEKKSPTPENKQVEMPEVIELSDENSIDDQI